MHKFVLTGGPCAGKTTALAYLKEKLMDRGFHPIMLPEAPTLLMLAGITPNLYPEAVFQPAVLDMMFQVDRIATAAAQARPDLKTVMFLDRAYSDCPPYMKEKGLYESTLAKLGLGTPVQVRDSLYEAVFHLRTAAMGAEEFYTKANNAARLETAEEARLRDEETLAAWVGHPHLRIIDNSTDFAGKMHRLDQEVCAAMGIPVPLEVERKFLCKPVDLSRMPVPHQRIEIEQIYLYSENRDVIPRIRKRGQDGQNVYFRTEKRFVRPGVNLEVESVIDLRDYGTSAQFQARGHLPIIKDRWCFVHQDQYFELDIMDHPRLGRIHLLEIELTEESEKKEPQLPPFLEVIREVTGDPTYSNYELSKAA